jgi:hypothetical protein
MRVILRLLGLQELDFAGFNAEEETMNSYRHANHTRWLQKTAIRGRQVCIIKLLIYERF